MSKPVSTILSAKELDELNLREAAQKGNFAAVKTLIEQGVNVNAAGPGSKKTALHWAGKYKHYKIVNALLEAGADQSLLDKDGCTPLDLAEKLKDNDSVIERLKSQFVIKEKEKINKAMQAVKPKVIDEKIIRASMDRLERYLSMNRLECNNILSAYMEQVHHYAKSVYPDPTIQNLWSYALSFIIPFLGNKSSNSSNEIQVKQADIKQKLDMNNLIAYHFVSMQGIFSVLNQPELLDSVIKEIDLKIASENQMNFEKKVTAMIAEFIVKQVRFLRILKLEEKNKRVYLKEFSAKDKQTLKILRKKLKGFVLKAEEALTELKTIVRESFSEYLVNPLGFFNFLDTYFDENVLDAFEYSNKIRGHIATDPKQFMEELKKSSLQHKSDILVRFKKYLVETKCTIQKTLAQKNKSLVRFGLMHSEEETESEQARKLGIKQIEGMVEEVIANNIQHFDESFTCTSEYLYFMYKLGQGLMRIANEIFTNIDSFSAKHLKTTAQAIRKQFLEKLSSSSTRFESDFEAVRLKEKQFSKERENQKREKENDEKMKLAAMLQQKKILEEKQAAEAKEKHAWIKKILDKVLLPKRDEGILEQIRAILNNSLSMMSKADFYTLIIKLEIEGYKRIQAQKLATVNNKLTLNLGKFHSFTLHERHGKDNIDNVDPGTIQDLRKMFEAIGINKDNWLVLLKSYLELDKITKSSASSRRG